MTFTSLDAIVKNILLKRAYSIHWYLDFLVYSKDGLRELSLDESIQTLRRVVVPVDQATFTAQLPSDYQDYTQVYVRKGQYIRPLVEDGAIDLVPNYDSNFDVQPYSEGVASLSSTEQNSYSSSAILSGYWWMVNWNAFGENLGRQFGGVGSYPDTFKINKAANEIKLNETLTIEEVVIEYIGDGMDADSATHIDVYAQQTIEMFAMWQFYLHNRSYSQADADDMERKYINERIKLRARLSDITIEKLKRTVQKNSIRVKY